MKSILTVALGAAALVAGDVAAGWMAEAGGLRKRDPRSLIISHITQEFAEGAPVAPTSAAVHRAALALLQEYRIEVNTKVLTACVAWPGQSEAAADEDAVLRGLFAARTDLSSDGQVPTNRLAIHAKRACLGWAARERIDCGCVDVDKNGRNVFAAPES